MDFKQKLSILNQKTIRTHGCEAGRASFLVDELGRYFACQNMLPYQACIGELENGIVSSIRDRYKSQFVSELKDCQQCWGFVIFVVEDARPNVFSMHRRNLCIVIYPVLNGNKFCWLI